MTQRDYYEIRQGETDRQSHYRIFRVRSDGSHLVGKGGEYITGADTEAQAEQHIGEWLDPNGSLNRQVLARYRTEQGLPPDPPYKTPKVPTVTTLFERKSHEQ